MIELTLPSREEITKEALRQKPDLYERIGQTNAVKFISNALQEIRELETAAQHRKFSLPTTPEEAGSIKAIMVIAAPGTYLVPRKIDRYRLWPWTEWMDHRRLEYGAYLVRKITEIKTGKKLTNNPSAFRETIAEQGPDLIYSGRYDERKMAEIGLKIIGKGPSEDIRSAILALGEYPEVDLARALKIKPANLPENKVHFLEGKIDNTVDSAEQLYFPESIKFHPGDQLGLVLHSPQAVRFMYNLQAVFEANKKAVELGKCLPFPNFPLTDSCPILKMFPMTIPLDPLTKLPTKQYPTLEICGLIHYAFYANPLTAALTPFPYTL